jgi:tRNA dimethylallyltransferase
MEKCYDYIMSDFKQLALIGPTASGKTSLAVKVAQKSNAHILSLDSLSIYKEIDIVSAKPTIKEREGINHFGIDHLYPNEDFDVTTFISLYRNTLQRCQEESKNLVIVGGTSFYLKILLEGVSVLPKLSEAIKFESIRQMQTPHAVYERLLQIDPDYMQSIKQGDIYRIEKALEVYLATGVAPSIYFKAHPPKPVITVPLPIYEIVWDRTVLRERIALRTEEMIDTGLIDEIIMLEKKYTRAPNCMKAIGIKETLMYLDGIYDKKMLVEKIAINTGRLAKRQETFNRSQFKNVIRGSVGELEKLLL